MSGNKIIVGIVTAAIAGLAIGLLIAPDDGKKTIKKIKKKTNSLAGELIDALEKSKTKAGEKASDLAEEGKTYGQDIADKAEGYSDTVKEEVNKF
ncbi:YtxH domain-containing protein [Dyadobacter sp. MSC1_007]|jgi:gas vesicle protein|uniref:YtxH domain-containing protein n=1 Tax=Dyadobacter sp. MSC1_007 TaxID=2909264 RepID=UPI00202EF70B|nr:YtxH domain-containing protein [Dyadobacter sp. MSC1_007]